MKTILFTITLLVSAQVFAMEAPPAPTFHALAEAPAHTPTHQPLIPLSQFPADIQRILYAEIMNGGLYATAHTLLALARTSKQHRTYINNNIIAILESQPTAKSIELVKILHKNTVSLPALSRAHVQTWCADASARLIQGRELFVCAGMPTVLDPKIKEQRLKEYFSEKNIALNWQTPIGTTLLLIAALTQQTNVVRLLLEAGANPNIADTMGATPLKRAKKDNAREIIALLLANGAQEDQVSDSSDEEIETVYAKRLYDPSGNFDFLSEGQESSKRPRN